MSKGLRAPTISNGMSLDIVYAHMRWLEDVTGLHVFVGLALEADNAGITFPKVVARLERRKADGTYQTVHKYAAEYPSSSVRTMEALCLHLLYELEKLAAIRP